MSKAQKSFFLGVSFLLGFTLSLLLSCSSGDDDVRYIIKGKEDYSPYNGKEEKPGGWLFLMYECGEWTPSAGSTIACDIKANLIQISYAMADLKDSTLYDNIKCLVLYEDNESAILREVARGTVVTDLGSRTANGALNIEDTRILPGEDFSASESAWLKTGGVPRDMASGQFLEDFLTFAAKKYEARDYPNVVLCIADHGSGPECESDVYTSKNDAAGRRLCITSYDDGERGYLTSADIKKALKMAGYSGGRRPVLIWEDCCYESSVEVIYELRGAGDYYLSSSNTSYSHDYEKLLKAFKTGATINEIGRAITNEYIDTNREFLIADAGLSSPYQSGDLAFTQSLVSLDEGLWSEVKSEVSALGAAIEVAGLDAKNIFRDALKDGCDDIFSYRNGAGLALDLGDFARSFIDSDNSDIKRAASSIISLMNRIIIVSGFYHGRDASKGLKEEKEIYKTSARPFGITIMGKFNSDLDNKDYSGAVGSFGVGNSWGTFLKTYWGANP